MKLKGRVINRGTAEGKAVVFEKPFSLIGDFDPNTGEITVKGHPLFGQSIANCILVIPTGKGGTIAPFILYDAKKKGKAPSAILCNEVEPLTAESALTVNIPIMDAFGTDLTKAIKNGNYLKVDANAGTVEVLNR